MEQRNRIKRMIACMLTAVMIASQAQIPVSAARTVSGGEDVLLDGNEFLSGETADAQGYGSISLTDDVSMTEADSLVEEDIKGGTEDDLIPVDEYCAAVEAGTGSEWEVPAEGTSNQELYTIVWDNDQETDTRTGRYLSSNGVTYEMNFQKWTGTGSLPSVSGNYYLTNDVNLNGTWNVVNANDISLCLNGKTIKGNGDKAIQIYENSILSIYDAKGCEGAITGGKPGVYVGYWDLNWDAENGTAGIFNLYSGTIKGNTCGVCAYLFCPDTKNRFNNTFNMYGGTITENEHLASNRLPESSALGGGVYLNRSSFYMYGGTIRDNTAERGAGVYLDRYSEFYMHGGRIIENTATDKGGGAYVTYIDGAESIFKMDGGEISNNMGGDIFSGLVVTFKPLATSPSKDWVSQYVIPNKATPLLANTFTREGFTFSYWEGSDGREYVDKESISITKRLYLVAQWTLNNFTVRFDPNGGIGSMPDERFYYKEAKPLSANKFTKPDYNFVSWNTVKNPTAADPGKGYADGADGSTISKINNDVATLYAQWEKKPDNPATVSINGWEYGAYSETTNSPKVENIGESGEVTISYKAKDAPDSSYSSKVPVEAGEYTVRATVAETVTYATTDVTADFTIARVDGAYTAPVAKTGLKYNGSPQTLIDAGKSSDGTLMYAVSNGGSVPGEDDFATALPAETNAGKYKVYYMLKGDKNHKDHNSNEYVTVSIDKVEYTNKNVSAELRYGMNGMYDLDAFIPEGGSPSVGTVTDNDKIFSRSPVVEGKNLKWAFVDDRAKVGKSATVKIPVKNATNYNDYELTVTLTVADCSHPRSELRHYKKATCTETGYTGDTCCAECNAVLKPGSVIPKDNDNHDFDGGTKTKEPTELVMGETTYTCKRCGAKKVVKDIPVLPAKDGRDYDDFSKDTKDGNVTGKADGTVSVGGEKVSQVEKDKDGNITSVKTEIWIGGLKASYTYTGAAIQPEFNVYDGVNKLTSGKDYSVSFANNKEAGSTATITVKLKGNYNAKDTKELKAEFKIDPAVLGRDVLVSDKAILWRRYAQRPLPDITWKATGNKIKNKNGFIFEYYKVDVEDIKLDGLKDVGTYYVKVIPKEDNKSFTGSATASITVAGKNDKNKLMSNASISFNPNKYTYTGNAVVPASGKYMVKLDKKDVPKDAYTVEFSNNTDPGTAKAVFTAIPGKGYYGSKTVTFTIAGGKELKKNGEGGFVYTYPESVTYAKGGVRPEVTITDNGTTLEPGKDYSVSYKYNKAVATKDLKNKSGKLIAPQMIVKGKGKYKNSVTLPFTITAQNISSFTGTSGAGSIAAADKVVSSSKKGYMKPSLTITDFDGKKLKAGTDYEIENYTVKDKDGKVIGTSAPTDKNPVAAEAGYIITANLKAKGKNYTGTATAEYRYIADASKLSKVKAEKLAEKAYTGYEVTLTSADLTDKLYVMENGTKKYLKPGIDFEILSYSNNIKKGTAKVTLKGKAPSYGGTKTLTFKIIPKTGDCKGALVDGKWK